MPAHIRGEVRRQRKGMQGIRASFDRVWLRMACTPGKNTTTTTEGTLAQW